MKIYFYDGLLNEAPGPPETRLCLVDAGQGVSTNLSTLENLNCECVSSNRAVLTNSIVALDHRYAWNVQDNHTEIYLWQTSKGAYIRIDELTDKEIRYAHRISHMYLAGVFGSGTK